MKITVIPSSFKGGIWANPSKSIMQRAVALAALSSGEVNISNPAYDADSRAALEIAKQMGATVTAGEDMALVKPGSMLKSSVWHAGESGLSARMFSVIAGLYEQDITITGRGSLLNRPMRTLIEALSQLGLEVEHNNFHLPLTVKGVITNYELALDFSSGSQVLTGLLIALGKAERDATVRVVNLASKPYIDLTMCVAKGFGALIESDDKYGLFRIKGNRDYHRRYFNIEGDWSGAAFHLVGAAINGEVSVTGINPRSKQADRAVLDALQRAGAMVKTRHNKVTVKKSQLKAFEFDATCCPDLFPPLAVLGAYCEGVTKIKGVSRLKHKESDRFLAIRDEFIKAGITIDRQGDYMLITGGKVKGATTHAHGDHRIAMALATLGLGAKDNIIIEGAECVEKSYPHYFLDYEILGGIAKDS